MRSDGTNCLFAIQGVPQPSTTASRLGLFQAVWPWWRHWALQQWVGTCLAGLTMVGCGGRAAAGPW